MRATTATTAEVPGNRHRRKCTNPTCNRFVGATANFCPTCSEDLRDEGIRNSGDDSQLSDTRTGPGGFPVSGEMSPAEGSGETPTEGEVDDVGGSRSFLSRFVGGLILGDDDG